MRLFLTFAFVLVVFAYTSIQCKASSQSSHEYDNIEADISSEGLVDLTPPTIALDSVKEQNQWASITHSTKIVPDATDSNVIVEDRGQGRRVKFTLPTGYQLPSAVLSGPRPPGSLLLNMLTKNERDHLDRVLPQWSKIIDCWVIGVDRHNTDDSEAVIRRHLGHLPGRVVVVDFDGMGPTWTELVKVGYQEFPQCTHGIVADADFAPRHPTLDKRQLDVRCSKHMYTIWTQDLSNARKMDWIYRNVPGAHVSRRTHQIVEAPTLPGQEVYQTLVDLEVVEREGGYQDRTPGKMERYIGFLEGDLSELPGDPRSLYYVGYAYYDLFTQTTRHWEALPASQKSSGPAARSPLGSFDWRAFIPADAAPGARHTATINGATLHVAPLRGNHGLTLAFPSLPRYPAAAEDTAHVPREWRQLPGGRPALFGDVVNAYRWMYLEMAVRFFVLRAHSTALHRPDPLLDLTHAHAAAAGAHTAAASRNELVAGQGNAEERWFAMLKLGEIFERFYTEWPVAEHWYNECIRSDPDRADAFFYVGQHYRLHGDHARAATILREAALLPMPQRSLFQWFSLYMCVARLEWARAVMGMGPRDQPQSALRGRADPDFTVGRDSAKLGLSVAAVREILSQLSAADCRHDQQDAQQQQALVQELARKLKRLEMANAPESSSSDAVRVYHTERVEPLRTMLKRVGDYEDHLRQALADSFIKVTPKIAKELGEHVSAFDVLQYSLDPVRSYLEQFGVAYNLYKLDQSMQTKKQVLQYLEKCKPYRSATATVIRIWNSHNSVFKAALSSDRFDDISQSISMVKRICR